MLVLTLYPLFFLSVPDHPSLCSLTPRSHPLGLAVAPPGPRPSLDPQPTPKAHGSLPGSPGAPPNQSPAPPTSPTLSPSFDMGAALYRAAPSLLSHFLTASLPLAGAVSSISQEHLIASPSNTTPFTAPRSRRALILSAQKVCLPNREEITLKLSPSLL